MEDKLNKIIQMDCLEYLKSLPDGCVNLCFIDPPYNISHAKWDKWKCQKEYVNWLGSVFLECQRVLKDNGSFYFWHNDFQQMAELQHWISQNTKFVFNSMISWVKPNFRNMAWQGRTENSNLRSWFNIQEYCLYYTFEDSGTGLNDIYDRKDCFVSIKEYMCTEKKKLKEAKGFLTDAKFNEFINKITETSSVVSRHYFANSQWTFPVKHLYEKLQTTGFFQKPYEELRSEYEELRARFNIQNGQDYNNVWYSKEDNGNKSKINGKLHTCEKPQDLLQKIILTSSNENDIILDCFAGSGSLAQACLETNRNFLCCERDEGYVKIANDRLANWQEDLLRQDKWLNDRGVVDFESDIKEQIKQEQTQETLI
jgi:DNA modification methylase